MITDADGKLTIRLAQLVPADRTQEVLREFRDDHDDPAKMDHEAQRRTVLDSLSSPPAASVG